MSRKLRFALGMLAVLALFLGTSTASALEVITASPEPASTPGRVNVPYTDILLSTNYSTGESGTVAWGSSGLPSGLTLIKISELSARITGTPTSSGTFPFTVTADIATGIDRSYSSSILIQPALGSVSPSSLPAGVVGTAYPTTTFTVGGGTGPFVWWSSGTLPTGLALTAGGVLSGTPTLAGTYNFTVGVVDTASPTAVSSRAYSVTVTVPPYTPIASYGQMLYIDSLVRNADGVITGTGDLYVKNLETEQVSRITQYPAQTIILNPQFTPAGDEVLYTANVSGGTGRYKAYLVSTRATVTGDLEGVIVQVTGADVKYAAISPNYDGSTSPRTGLLAYTRSKTDRTQLWVYNFSSGSSTLIRSVAGLTIDHPVFVDNTTIAYLGTVSGVQDIYTISASGGTATKLTSNTVVTPQYGRLLSSNRNALLNPPLLIYAKRTWQQFAYNKWDVFVREVGGQGREFNVTNTPDLDEYGPAFYGDNVNRGVTLGQSLGQMFYEATILTDRDIWQANYDTGTASDSNVSKMQRTALGVGCGLPNWSPLSAGAGVEEPVIRVGDTRIVWTKDWEIARSDHTGASWDTTGTILTTDGNQKSDPTLAENGGTIIYTSDNSGTDNLKRMNHDGSGNTVYASAPADVNQANISADGRWVVYVYKTGEGTYDIRAKLSSDTAGAGTVLVTGLVCPPKDPAFNPGVTKITYAYDTHDGNHDIFTLDVTVDNIAGTITAGAAGPANLTNSMDANDREPAFSRDGTRIIYVSDRWDGLHQIFTIGVNGSGIELVVAHPGSALRYPMYGPVNSGIPEGTDMIAWVEGGTIHTGVLYRDKTKNPGYGSGYNPVQNAASTGISPNASYLKYSWGIRRTQGTVVNQRNLPERAAAGVATNYEVLVDADEAALVNSYTVNEVLPNTFNVTGVLREGSVAVTYTTFANTPSTGLQTIKMVFTSGWNGGTGDHALRINYTPAASGYKTVTGDVNYFLAGVPVTTDTRGNQSLLVGNPYLPVDLYDVESNLNPDGIVQDYDLLYAIDCWVADAQIPGYGPAWPSDISYWDNIILAVIDIWATPSGNRGWMGPVAPVAGVQVTNASTENGQYVYLQTDPAYVAGYVYHPSGPGAVPGYASMFWAEGAWTP